MRACAVEMHMGCHKRNFAETFTGKCRTRRPRTSFCVSLRNRNAHGHVTRGILCGNLEGKCRTLIPGPAFCGHVTRDILCGNLPGKRRTLPIPPRLNTGPYITVTVRTPSVWPHCLGKTSNHSHIFHGKSELCINSKSMITQNTQTAPT